jgi:LysM repeat protein
LAPIALAATITATYLVVHAALNDRKSTPQQQVVRTSATSPTQARRGRGSSTYRVKSGDTLSNISAKTGVPLPTLETLNPNINPNALQTGQRLRLRR